MTCPYCQGQIGLDCFNVEECGQITMAMQQQAQPSDIAEMENEISALRAELAAAREALDLETKRLDTLIDSQLVIVSAFDDAYCLADRDGCEVGEWYDTPREAIDAGMDGES